MRKTGSTQNYRTGPGFEKEDKKAGAYEKDSYYIERVENIKGYGHSQYWHFGK